MIAHSMGNQIVVDALAHAQDAGLNLKLSELIMAAPDVDSDVFKSLITRTQDRCQWLDVVCIGR